MEENNFIYQIFCDMDGVLVDFEDAAVNKINEALSKENPPLKKLADRVKKDLGRDFVISSDLERNSPTKSRAAANYMYRLLEDDEEFWSNLEWMPNGKKLWEAIANNSPYILTTPMRQSGSMSGKLHWIRKNLGLDKIKGIIFSHNKSKYAFNQEQNRPNILIDDLSTNIEPWIKKSGVGLKYYFKNIDSILEKLEQLARLSIYQ